VGALEVRQPVSGVAAHGKRLHDSLTAGTGIAKLSNIQSKIVHALYLCYYVLIIITSTSLITSLRNGHYDIESKLVGALSPIHKAAKSQCFGHNSHSGGRFNFFRLSFL